MKNFQLFTTTFPSSEKSQKFFPVGIGLIEKTEELITKEKNIKEGLVSHLLNFSANRSYLKLSLTTFLVPTSYPVEKPTKSYYALSIRSHGKGTFFRFVEDPNSVAMETLYSVHANELIVNITFAWEGAIAITSVNDAGKLVSHRFPTFSFKENVVTREFFRHVIKTKRFIFFLGLVSPGGAGRNRVLNQTDFLNLEWPIPPIKEQNRISGILNTCDVRINALEKKLNLLRVQKLGLMTKLFAGI